MSPGAFASRIEEAIRAAAPSAVVSHQESGILTVQTGTEFAEANGFLPGMSVNLPRMYWEFVESGSPEEKLAEFCRMQAELARNVEDILHFRDWDRQKNRIIARVLPLSWNQMFSENEENRPYVSHPLNHTGLMVVIAVDYPFDSLMFATPRAVAEWGQEKLDLILRGVANTGKALLQEKAEEVPVPEQPNGWRPSYPIYGLKGDRAGFQSSAILVKEELIRPLADKVPGKPIIAIPASNIFLLTGDEDPEMRRYMAGAARVLTDVSMSGVPLTSSLLYYDRVQNKVLSYH